ncbi:hypothetical protein NTHI1209_00335 [Haemophilus influenzae]|uniref:Uncharacterized protein n=1 Tax=Haemophilus influenzae TaxID=727 RepID=A0A158SV39_HAEIF|nr:hypothetical protein NTHI1209_00335 [Haemophilus influenzae]
MKFIFLILAIAEKEKYMYNFCLFDKCRNVGCNSLRHFLCNNAIKIASYPIKALNNEKRN